MKMPKYDLIVSFDGYPDYRMAIAGPLAACQQRGLQAMMYGVFAKVEGKEEWEFRKPTSAVVRLSPEDEKEEEKP